MATTKTLTPTNQTITIDTFQGEKPDHRHVADAEGKLADAVNAIDWSTKGKQIPNNSDLNTYRTPGKYYSSSTSTTSTMSNAPVSGGFSLFVLVGGYDWVNQFVIPVNGNVMYHRFYTSSTSTWSDWVAYGGQTISVIRYNATLEANQYVTAPFTHFADVSLDTSKGTPVSARINASSTKAVIAIFNGGGTHCFIQGIGAQDITVDVTYVKNPATA